MNATDIEGRGRQVSLSPELAAQRSGSRVSLQLNEAMARLPRRSAHLGAAFGLEGFGVGDRPWWAPDGVDISRPSPARVYDFLLGGAHNFEVDRELARQLVAVRPDTVRTVRDNRAFLRRVVRFLAAAGVRQFVDIGSGIPTVGNVHEVAHSVAPDARVVYVDSDLVAVLHSEAMLACEPLVAAVRVDVRDVESLLSAVAGRGLIDFGRPVGLLLVAVMHFVSDEDGPAGIVDGLFDAVVSGSYLGLSHVSHPVEMTGEDARMVEAYERRTGMPLVPRSQAQVADLLGRRGRLVGPGVVAVPLWRPEDQAETVVGDVPSFGAVAVKP